jgi:hypothetical protein
MEAENRGFKDNFQLKLFKIISTNNVLMSNYYANCECELPQEFKKGDLKDINTFHED